MGFVRNQADPLGTQIGENLARFADDAEAKFGKELGFIPKRCASCAFSLGTLPNKTLTTANALKCAMEGETFYCHHKIDGVDPVCAGWILLNDGKKTEAPWDFIEGKN